jgi:hypothetical protein
MSERLSESGGASSLREKYFPEKVSLGDDYKYPIKVMGESTYKLDS